MALWPAGVAPSSEYARGYDVPPPWLNTLVDPTDNEGVVHISPEPGLGDDINWDDIDENPLDLPGTPATTGPASPLPRTLASALAGRPALMPRSL